MPLNRPRILIRSSKCAEFLFAFARNYCQFLFKISSEFLCCVVCMSNTRAMMQIYSPVSSWAIVRVPYCLVSNYLLVSELWEFIASGNTVRFGFNIVALPLPAHFWLKHEPIIAVHMYEAVEGFKYRGDYHIFWNTKRLSRQIFHVHVNRVSRWNVH